MALTLDEHGYQWDYESALWSLWHPQALLATYSDKGSAACHGGHNW